MVVRVVALLFVGSFCNVSSILVHGAYDVVLPRQFARRAMASAGVIEGGAQKTGSGELSALALRVAQLSVAGSLNVSAIQEFRAVKAIMSKVASEPDELSKFCAAEVERAAADTFDLGNKTAKMHDKAVKQATQADKDAKNIPKMVAEVKKLQKTLDMHAVQRKKESDAYTLLAAKLKKDLKKHHNTGKINIKNAANYHANVLASDALLEKQIQAQNTEASEAVKFAKERREALERIKNQEHSIKVEGDEFQKIRSELIKHSKELQEAENKLAGKKQYAQMIATKCKAGAGKAQQKEVSATVNSAIKALQGLKK